MKIAGKAESCHCCKNKGTIKKKVDDPHYLVPGKLYRRDGGDIEIDVPKYLDCE